MSNSTMIASNCQIEFKDVGDSGSGTYSAYFAAFDNVDRGGDLIVPGAFKNLDEFTRDGSLLLGHDGASLPIATVDSASQDDRGLFVTGTWHGTPAAQAARATVRERLARGKSVGASIGYQATDFAFETLDGNPIRIIKGLDLYEVSLVNVPMNPSAQFTSVKSRTRVVGVHSEPRARLAYLRDMLKHVRVSRKYVYYE